MIKKVLISIGVLTIFLSLLFTAGYRYAGTLKPRVEMALSKALNMQAKINRMSFCLCPLSISAKDVEIRNSGTSVAHIGRIDLRLKLVSVLKREFRLMSLELVRPELNIIRLKSGRLNIEPVKGTPQGNEFRVEKIIIKNGNVSFHKAGISIKGLNASLYDFQKKNSGKFTKSFAFKGNIKSRSFEKGPVALSGIKAGVEAKNGRFFLSPVTFKAMHGNGKGYMKADLSGITPVMELSVGLFKFSMEKCWSLFCKKDMISGDMDVFAKLKLRGKLKYLTKNINGNVSIRGKGLSFSLVNIDKLISRFNKTQKFNALDLGAFLIMGPVGPAVTRGLEFSNVLKKVPAGNTEVKALVSDWEIKSGMAMARDVAIATKKNRIALKGTLDLDNKRFDEIKVAVVDEKGRAVMGRNIDGPFKSPDITGKPNLGDTIMSPAVKLLKGAAEYLFGSKRDPFYSGSVAAPN